VASPRRLISFCKLASRLWSITYAHIRFMLLNQGSNLHHQFEVGIFRWDGKDIGLKAIVLSQASFEILEFGQDKEVIRLPM
jgi:hypothetical protein